MWSSVGLFQWKSSVESCLRACFIYLFQWLLIYLGFVVEDVTFAGKTENVFYAKYTFCDECLFFQVQLVPWEVTIQSLYFLNRQQFCIQFFLAFSHSCM